jgi:C4-dicarboxylate-binding protein DctP
MPHLTRRTVAASALALPFLRRAGAAEPLRLRASLDTTPAHQRTVSVRDYLAKVEAASGGRIVTQVFDSGQLFADRDVIKALVQGQAEMAAPGTWLIAGFVPNADLLQLPPFYGLSQDHARRIIDGPIGQSVNEELNQKLKVRVLGRWLDLGFNNWYSTRTPLNSVDDLKGLKIRNSGGFAQAWRARFFGGVPNMTAWPDVPLAMSQGTFDALQSTNESCASSKLWESGLRYGLEDHQNLSEYVPMISGAFWSRLEPAQQEMMTGIWAEHIGAYRDNMARAQERARETLVSHGVTMVAPPPEALAAARTKQLPETEHVAAEMKVSPELLKRIMAELGNGAA